MWPDDTDALIALQDSLAAAPGPGFSFDPTAPIGACYVCFARGGTGSGAAGDPAWAAAALTRRGRTQSTVAVSGLGRRALLARPAGPAGRGAAGGRGARPPLPAGRAAGGRHGARPPTAGRPGPAPGSGAGAAHGRSDPSPSAGRRGLACRRTGGRLSPAPRRGTWSATGCAPGPGLARWRCTPPGAPTPPWRWRSCWPRPGVPAPPSPCGRRAGPPAAPGRPRRPGSRADRPGRAQHEPRTGVLSGRDEPPDGPAAARAFETILTTAGGAALGGAVGLLGRGAPVHRHRRLGRHQRRPGRWAAGVRLAERDGMARLRGRLHLGPAGNHPRERPPPGEPGPARARSTGSTRAAAATVTSSTGGATLRRGFTFTLGNVVSNASTGRGIPADRQRLLDRHEGLHIWQSRTFGPLYQAVYVAWFVLGPGGRAGHLGRQTGQARPLPPGGDGRLLRQPLRVLGLQARRPLGGQPRRPGAQVAPAQVAQEEPAAEASRAGDPQRGSPEPRASAASSSPPTAPPAA